MAHRAVHSARLERWLGAAEVEKLSRDMVGWYGPPIAVGGVPGGVFVGGDGDFAGHIDAGFECSKLDRARDVLRRMKRAYRMTARRSQSQLNAGFSSLADLVANYKNGETHVYPFTYVGATGVSGASHDYWIAGTLPIVGSIGSAAPGGRVPTSANGGFVPQNTTETNAQKFLARADLRAVNSANILLVDRIFDVAKTMNSTATEAVTGVPTRYQGTTPGAQNSAEGNFMHPSVITVLAAGAHNWTVCQYTNQAGTTAQSFPSFVGISACAVRRIDMPVGRWFAPLADGDTGVAAISQLQCSAAIATGTMNFVINHPIAWFPCPLANTVCRYEFVRTAVNMTRIYNDACLNMISVNSPSTSTIAIRGSLTTISS